MVEVLLNTGANANVLEEGAFSALHIACENSNWRIVKMLLDKGAKKNLKNVNGHIPKDLTFNIDILALL